MKRKRKGFTLIELLAVLVVLAILALITIPIVLRIINNVQAESYKRSIEGYVDAVHNGLSEWKMLNPASPYSNYDFSNVDTKGNNVVCDEQSVDNDGNITLRGCYIGNRTKIYSYVNDVISEDNNYNFYAIGKKVTVNNISYYIIGSGDNYVTLLKETPLTTAEVNQYGASHINMYEDPEYEEYQTAVDYNGYGSIYYLSSSTCNSNDQSGCSTNYNTSDVAYVVNNWVEATINSSDLVEIGGYSARIWGTADEQTNFLTRTTCGTIHCNEYVVGPEYLTKTQNLGWTLPTEDAIYFIKASQVYEITDAGDICQRLGTITPVINVKKGFVL